MVGGVARREAFHKVLSLALLSHAGHKTAFECPAGSVALSPRRVHAAVTVPCPRGGRRRGLVVKTVAFLAQATTDCSFFFSPAVSVLPSGAPRSDRLKKKNGGGGAGVTYRGPRVVVALFMTVRPQWVKSLHFLFLVFFFHD